ncbi:hypothetical protein ACWDTP_30255 [Mycobacterium sp. NPDC003449]
MADSLTLRGALVGAAAAIGWAPLAAGLTAVAYRFPVPFSGYADGLADAPTAALASLFYLVLGGFVVLGVLGATAGAVLARVAPGRPYALAAVAGLVIAILGAVALAVLEYLIGPW